MLCHMRNGGVGPSESAGSRKVPNRSGAAVVKSNGGGRPGKRQDERFPSSVGPRGLARRTIGMKRRKDQLMSKQGYRNLFLD